jgi:hypothetical protein
VLTGLGLFAYKNPHSVYRIHDYFTLKQADILNQETLISLTYALDRQSWTEFSLPQATNRVRAISNCVVPADYPFEDEPLQYSLIYEIYDAGSGRVIREGIYYFNTTMTLYQNSSEQEPEPAAFFREPGDLPTDGRIMLLDLTELTGQADDRRIRFKIGSIDPVVSTIIIRVYARQQVIGRNDPLLWNRLHTSKKEKLAKGNIYPQDLLTQNEISSLLENQWMPIGPRGIPDRDFKIQRMYIRRDISDKSTESSSLLSGLTITPGFPLTFAVPEEGKNLQLQFTPHEDLQAGNGNIVVRWYGQRVHENLSWTIPWQGISEIFSHNFPGGLLEMEADIPVHVTLHDNDLGGQEISPEFIFSKMYVSRPETELSYTIRHIDSHPTPVRIQIRSFMPEDGQQREIELQCSLSDKEGRTIQEKQLRFTAIPSRYDILTDNELQSRVSDPAYFYFHLPVEVTGLRINSEEPLLIAVANRPAAYMQEMMVPEEYFRTSFDKGNLPSWFTFPPRSAELQPNPETVLIQLQHRPPERKEELLSGIYFWEAFRPEGQWQGNYLLFPKDPESPDRTESLTTTYHAIPPDKSIQITTGAPGNLDTLRPNLIFMQEKDIITHIRLLVDGQPYYDRSIKGRRGLLSMPPLAAGSHTLKLTSTGDCSFFISNLLSGENPHSLRFAYRLTTQGIQFDYTKEREEELLSFFYYAPDNSKERTRISVQLLNPAKLAGPFSGFTQNERIYDIRAGDAPVLPLLYTRSKNTDIGQRFFFPLQADLPQGTYTFRIKPLAHREGFVLMYRVTPGQYDWSNFFREEN